MTASPQVLETAAPAGSASRAARASRPRSTGFMAVVELVKPRIMMMALLTAAGGLVLAPGAPTGSSMFWLMLGTGLIVGAANTLNMYLERETDCKMVRTQTRPLPEARLHPRIALIVGIALTIVALPVMAMGSNFLTAVLGVVAFVSYVGIYTPLKPRTHLATWVGAVPGAMPALMGYTAASGRIDVAGLSVFGLLFIWQIPHFHAIGYYRMHEYAAAGLKTLANVRGIGAVRFEIAAYIIVQVAASFAIVATGVAGGIYTAAAVIGGIAVLAQALPGALSRDAADPLWARRLFLLSIIYLPVMFIALVLGGRA
ncbi:MAG: protoheme IX farnesyltransferase [Myxococcales bacterium]|nr:protoheme IX farnesyltransferase [Myxococcales bacterium]